MLCRRVESLLNMSPARSPYYLLVDIPLTGEGLSALPPLLEDILIKSHHHHHIYIYLCRVVVSLNDGHAGCKGDLVHHLFENQDAYIAVLTMMVIVLENSHCVPKA